MDTNATAAATATAASEWREFQVAAQHELRLEVGPTGSVTLKLADGHAEVFGTELASGGEYVLGPLAQVAVFSYLGCVLRLRGATQSEYVGAETPVAAQLAAHAALEGVRADAAAFSTGATRLCGPRVLVLGPPDAGKTALATTLLNYAVRAGRAPLFADAGIQHASLSLPGCVAASVFSRVVDVEEGMGGTLASSGTSPIVFYYGYNEPTEKEKLYKKQVERLAAVVDAKLDSDPQVRIAGVIIDTPSVFAEPAGYPLLQHAIEAFKPTVIFVIGHERLFSDLHRLYQPSIASKNLVVLKLPKSGGVVSRDKAYRRALQSAKIREYFYGTPKFPLSPFSSIVGFHELHVRRVGDSTAAPSSALPIGVDRKAQETKIVKVEVGDILLNSILAVSHADRLDALGATTAVSAPALTADEETALILESNVAGFVYVSEVVDDDKRKKKTVTVLTPNPGRLPKKYLVMGALKWVETS
ncbi:Pre-mRNA cleavage complex II protein Clp1-domain-containing protein [Obelidium mucronatum]|nr:Pre-mRNA cleavage complex II protein Clp1-domain-containing protein [Obelidium mucronatum]